jgi:hypothetical protein
MPINFTGIPVGHEVHLEVGEVSLYCDVPEHQKEATPNCFLAHTLQIERFVLGFCTVGLTMETSIRFVSGSSSGVTVSGINQTTMNDRPPGTIINAAVQSWGSGTQAEIPRWGAFYTHPGSKIVVNTTTPNILPGNASEGIFLPAQANLPITGSAWGLM